MKNKKETRGGFRENAKRPLKYGEPTVSIQTRVPESQVEAFKKLVNSFLSKFTASQSKQQ